MRRLFLLFIVFVISFSGKGQLPSFPYNGNSSTGFGQNSVIGTKIGFQYSYSFVDTSAANSYQVPGSIVGFLKNMAGVIIRCVNDYYTRSNDLKSWIKISGGSGWLLTGNSGTSPGTNFLGTTDSTRFDIRTNNSRRISVLGNGNVGVGLTNPFYKLDVAGSGNFYASVDAGTVVQIENTSTINPSGLSVTTADNSSSTAILGLIAGTNNRFTVRNNGAVLFNNVAGTTGQVLQSNGGSNPPSWVNTSSFITNIYNSDGTLAGNRTIDGNSKTFYMGSLSSFGMDTHDWYYSSYSSELNSTDSMTIKTAQLRLDLPSKAVGRVLRSDANGLATWANASDVVSTPTLQQVTTAGSTSTDTITATNIKLSSATPYSMLRNIQNSFGGSDSVVIAAGVIRGDASGGSGSRITWRFVSDYTTDHGKLFFDSVASVGTGAIRVYFPNTVKVVSFLAGPDETLSKEGMTMGASVALNYADIFCYLPVLNSGTLTGNGTTTWTKSSQITPWSVSYNSGTGTTSFNYSTLTPYQNYDAVTVTYQGTNPYLVKRVYSGLGSYNAGFQLTDIFGNPITGNTSSSDRVAISGTAAVTLANGYQVDGSLIQADIWTSTANIWIIAVFKK